MNKFKYKNFYRNFLGLIELKEIPVRCQATKCYFLCLVLSSFKFFSLRLCACPLFIWCEWHADVAARVYDQNHSYRFIVPNNDSIIIIQYSSKVKNPNRWEKRQNGVSQFTFLSKPARIFSLWVFWKNVYRLEQFKTF